MDNSISYHILAHLKKIPSLLIVYDVLHMSSKLRASMVYALTHPDEFVTNEKIARASWQTAMGEGLYMPTVTFEDTDHYLDDPCHNRPLFITCTIDDQSVSRVMIDDYSTFNILSAKTLAYLGVDLSQLRPNILFIQCFNQNEQRPLGFIKLRTKFGHIEDWTPFYIIVVDTKYNTLIRRPWMHKYQVTPSTFHQCIKYP